jgi:anti-sigma regulatory factor (Ser/Thr protein kinase)
LGTLPGAPSVAATAQLPQGSTLVLFSDGAVAASGALSAAGLDRLAEVSRAALAAPGALAGDAPGELAAAIVEGLLDSEERPDDIAVLVAHRRAETTQPLELDLPAVPAALPTVRRHLGGWLAGLGMGEQDRVGVMVAVGEATANAAEHAYRGVEPGRMQVTAAVDVDGQLTVTVRDQGRWRPPDRDPGDRGRGLLIMRQLVDGVVLQGEHGTTVTLSMRLRRRPEDDEDRPGGTSAADVVVDRSGERPVVRSTRSAPSRCGSGCWRPATAAPAGWSWTSRRSPCSAARRCASSSRWPGSRARRAGGWSCTHPRAGSPGTSSRSAGSAGWSSCAEGGTAVPRVCGTPAVPILWA